MLPPAVGSRDWREGGSCPPPPTPRDEMLFISHLSTNLDFALELQTSPAGAGGLVATDLTNCQSWARLFWALTLALQGEILSHLRFRVVYWTLNNKFRFCLRASYFSRSYFRISYIQHKNIYIYTYIHILSRKRTAGTGRQNRTAITGHPERDRQNVTGRT